MLLLSFLTGIPVVTAVSSLAGVNIAGFDFGVEITGTANLKNALAPLKEFMGPDGAGQMNHFAKDDGLNLFRLPVSWQFLINNAESVSVPSNTTAKRSLNMGRLMNGTTGNGTQSAAASGALDATNFGKYDALVQACLATGAKCIIDIHNYARFNNKIIGQGGPTDAEFANLWSQIATKYAKESNVIFGLMNEPHDIPDLKVWATTCQAAVTAIRKAGATTQLILLPGNNFTSVTTFISNGSAGNLSTIRNPDGSLTGLIFDVHKYLDVDNSGTHLECTTDHIADGFQPLATFLRANNRTAILSETGGGNTTSCLTNLCATLKFVNTNSDVYLGYAGWGAGGFSATDYNLTETPFTANGTFTDQKIVSQCIVGMRSGAGSNGTLGNTSTGADGPLKSFVISGATTTFDRSWSIVAVSVGMLCFGVALIL
ncbi:glycoside hydrolase superfamily [Tricladium varicosporioides]|nr:glycoside hydrolase superfamily [Hymenoscyphus varicosporioides]